MHRSGTRYGSIRSQITYDARKNHKGAITGFKLDGIVPSSAVTRWGAWTPDNGTNSDGQLSLCLSGNEPGPWITKDTITVGATALYVNFASTSVKLQ